NKGKSPAYLVDYEVPPYVHPQDPTPVGHYLPPSSGVRLRNRGNEDIRRPQPPPLLPQSQQTNAAYPSQPPSAAHLPQPPHAVSTLPQQPTAARPPAEDDVQSIKSHRSTHSMFSQISVGAMARQKQLEGELSQKMLLADMEEEVD